MSKLLTVTAVAEAATGVGLLVAPSLVGQVLLGNSFDPLAVFVGRVAGAALIALGVACWLARNDTQSRAAKGLVGAMLFYDVAIGGLLAFAGIHLGLHGIALWPAMVIHALLAVWSVAWFQTVFQTMNA